CLQESNWSYSF
nr:immunoglobulin light chain junction region [Macaca mulatta]MOV78188.1 immunoglobulin light chain junction region [Macaca mulatta]MOV78391.1 immunoglobulin light chain junction region [Macaca mulatta]MOV78621.1 immunoglobulin light chain junction region [Macaca mulatta]MOV78898.1 immunoglobulin light chain junction region [Macaca mulatta]